jgi:hypothetical protein
MRCSASARRARRCWANLSYERDAVVHWDPEAMKLV